MGTVVPNKVRQMGLTKATKIAAPGPKGAPWFLPSGIYPADGRQSKVTIEKGEGAGYIYRISFVPESNKAPSPLDLPIVNAILDGNSQEDVRDLYEILGTPHADGVGVKWGDDGLLTWNGETEDNSRLSGRVELTIKTRIPKHRPAREGFPEGWFSATYEVSAVNPPGESESISLDAQRALVESRQTTLPDTITPPPPPKKK